MESNGSSGVLGDAVEAVARWVAPVARGASTSLVAVPRNRVKVELFYARSWDPLTGESRRHEEALAKQGGKRSRRPGRHKGEERFPLRDVRVEVWSGGKMLYLDGKPCQARTDDRGRVTIPVGAFEYPIKLRVVLDDNKGRFEFFNGRGTRITKTQDEDAEEARLDAEQRAAFAREHPAPNPAPGQGVPPAFANAFWNPWLKSSQRAPVEDEETQKRRQALEENLRLRAADRLSREAMRRGDDGYTVVTEAAADLILLLEALFSGKRAKEFVCKQHGVMDDPEKPPAIDLTIRHADLGTELLKRIFGLQSALGRDQLDLGRIVVDQPLLAKACAVHNVLLSGHKTMKRRTGFVVPSVRVRLHYRSADWESNKETASYFPEKNELWLYADSMGINPMILHEYGHAIDRHANPNALRAGCRARRKNSGTYMYDGTDGHSRASLKRVHEEIARPGWDLKTAELVSPEFYEDAWSEGFATFLSCMLRDSRHSDKGDEVEYAKLLVKQSMLRDTQAGHFETCVTAALLQVSRVIPVRDGVWKAATSEPGRGIQTIFELARAWKAHKIPGFDQLLFALHTYRIDGHYKFTCKRRYRTGDPPQGAVTEHVCNEVGELLDIGRASRKGEPFDEAEFWREFFGYNYYRSDAGVDGSLLFHASSYSVSHMGAPGSSSEPTAASGSSAAPPNPDSFRNWRCVVRNATCDAKFPESWFALEHSIPRSVSKPTQPSPEVCRTLDEQWSPLALSSEAQARIRQFGSVAFASIYGAERVAVFVRMGLHVRESPEVIKKTDKNDGPLGMFLAAPASFLVEEAIYFVPQWEKNPATALYDGDA